MEAVSPPSSPIPYPAAAAPAVEPARHWLDAPATPFTRWLEKYRFVFLAAIAVFILVQFNGQWRIGLDSSLYRGVAENLWQGNGYTFAGRRQTLVYPGLPFLLALSHKITGSNSIVPVLVLFNVLSVLTLVGVYHLIRLRYPLWIAVVVMCGVGLNSRFVQQAQEVMTDAPFLFGCVMAMLGWELLAIVKTRRRLISAAALLLLGLFVAATMRPTFWVLAVAWAIVLVWNVVRHRDRRSWISLIIVIGLVALFAAWRIRNGNAFKGGYELQFMQSLAVLGDRVMKNGPPLFTTEIPVAFFGEKLWIFGLPMGLMILGGCLLVTRRQPLWGLQVFILTAVMLIMSDVPRYYLMVLPTLWLGYVLALLWLTQRLQLKYRDWTLFGLFSVANCINIVLNLGLFHEQHFGEFLRQYHKGEYVRLVEMAKVIRERVKPDEVVIGPYGQVLSYLSGRAVLNGKLLDFETKPVSRYPHLIAAAKPTYLVGPDSAYRTKDEVLGRLVERGIVVPGRLLAQTKFFWLAEATVQVPERDWKKLPTVPVRPLADRPARRVLTPEEQANRELKAKRLRKQIRAEREERRARNERKAIRQAREQRRRELEQQQQQQQQLQQPATQPTGAVPLEWTVPLDDLGRLTFDTFDHTKTNE